MRQARGAYNPQLNAFQLIIDGISPPDDTGHLDGRELAAELIRNAFRALAPYTHNCPACTNALFSQIANTVLDEMHRDRAARGQFQRHLWKVDPNAPGSSHEHVDRIAAEIAPILDDHALPPSGGAP